VLGKIEFSNDIYELGNTQTPIKNQHFSLVRKLSLIVNGQFIAKAWRVLKLWLEETSSTYGSRW
jgi:hypothetical protein